MQCTICPSIDVLIVHLFFDTFGGNNMIKRSLVLAGLVAFASSSAFAEVTALTATFAGGCKSANTGSCTIKVSASGDTSGASVLLKHADSQKGSFRKVSNTAKSIASGSTSFRFRNKSGCYVVVTADNGNDVADVSSRKICEK